MGFTHWEWGSNANAGVTEVFMERLLVVLP